MRLRFRQEHIVPDPGKTGLREFSVRFYQIGNYIIMFNMNMRRFAVVTGIKTRMQGGHLMPALHPQNRSRGHVVSPEKIPDIQPFSRCALNFQHRQRMFACHDI